MNLTKKEAIELHRKMWNWIADETEKRKRIVTKADYFKELLEEVPDSLCYCCEYVDKRFNEVKEKYACEVCPLIWKDVDGHVVSNCVRVGSMFSVWRQIVYTSSYIDPNKYQVAADLARQIANLPEKEDEEI